MRVNTESDWLRVNPRRPCPVCGHNGWCLIAADGSAAICARIESGKRAGAAGWLHRLRDTGWRPTRTRQVRVRPRCNACGGTDFGKLAARYVAAVDPGRLFSFAESLGVGCSHGHGYALERLGVGWDGECFTFPMVDDCLRVVGIRRRFASGRKLSVKGGHEGLFIPSGLASDGQVLICEGPTDCAALLNLGFDCVGRPSCIGGTDYLTHFLHSRPVVIVADADGPGRRGAAKLASALLAVCAEVKVIEPPGGEDAREWVVSGATPGDVRYVIELAEPHRLVVHSRRVTTW